jgi:hypothetical protein
MNTAPAQPADDPLPPSRGFAVRSLTILWPSFLMAGVLEALVFVVVDPGDLRWFGAEPIVWPAQTVYSVTFLIFWLVIALASAMAVLMTKEPAEAEKPRGLARHWP